MDSRIKKKPRLKKKPEIAQRIESDVEPDIGMKPRIEIDIEIVIPGPERRHEQYVMNTITKAWCRFTDWPAEDFAVFNGELYFCAGGAVYKAWSGSSDNGNAIVAEAKTAFSNFNTPGRNKQFKMIRPVMAANGSFSFLADIDVDFRDDDLAGLSFYSVAPTAVWDTAVWDADIWAEGYKVLQEWIVMSEWTGVWAAGKIKIQTNALTVQWMSTDYIYEVGGIYGP